MKTLDLRKKTVRPSHAHHTKHQNYLNGVKARARRQTIGRTAVAASFFVLSTVMIVPHMAAAQDQYWSWARQQTDDIQKVRMAYTSRYTQLPVEENDPKLQALIAFLQEKKSPLVKYAGELSRLPNWKVLLGIAQAESNLCKKTSKNNCWGIGSNNTPISYNDISESLYYADYLMSKYGQLGMNPLRPESIVRTYVGYDHPGWVNTVRSVFYELKQRGLN